MKEVTAYTGKHGTLYADKCEAVISIVVSVTSGCLGRIIKGQPLECGDEAVADAIAWIAEQRRFHLAPQKKKR